MSQEIWKPVPGYLGYEVSNLGRVRSFKRGSAFILSASPESNGYPRVYLRKNGKTVHLKVGCLVMRAFVGPRPRGLEVCHNDNNKLNNNLENLRYDTHSSNIQDQWNAGRPAMLNTKKVRQIREEFARGGVSLTTLARKHEVSMSTASLVVSGKRRPKAGGPIRGQDY